MSADTYRDDRRGSMRVHVADERARRACTRFSRDALREWAKAHGSAPLRSSLNKRDLAWYMAQDGLIADDGTLRIGFPDPAPLSDELRVRDELRDRIDDAREAGVDFEAVLRAVAHEQPDAVRAALDEAGAPS